ncbi:hypothetical protein CHUAL_003602 [Chamberlinius hualienensis]
MDVKMNNKEFVNFSKQIDEELKIPFIRRCHLDAFERSLNNGTFYLYDNYYYGQDITRTSKRSFTKLTLVKLTNLQIRRPNIGCYVFLRIIDPSYFGPFLATVVEDSEGNLCGLQVFNYLDSHSFTIGTVLIIKEPSFFKRGASNTYIRCDSPTDIIFLTKNHWLFNLTKNTAWKNELYEKENDPVFKEPLPQTVEMWNERAFGFYNKKWYISSQEAYLLGLRLCKKENDWWILLQINLAAVYYRLGYFEKMLSVALKVLEKFPRNENGLFRAGQAYYRLNKFEEANDYFVRICHLRSGGVKVPVIKALIKTTQRLKERKGRIDVDALEAKCRANPTKILQCAEYIGPLECFKEIYRATEKVKKGTLLMVSKAIAVVFNERCSVNSNIMCDMSNQVTQVVAKNPKTFGKMVYSLPIGDYREENGVPLYCDAPTNNEPICHAKFIFDACIYNSVFIPNLTLTLNSNYKNSVGLALFYRLSFFRYRHKPNVYTKIVNNIMLMYAGTDLLAGEEIFLDSLNPICVEKSKIKARYAKG